MSVQKRPDRRGGVDDGKIHWEQDLKPFSRLPREPRPDVKQRVPAWIPLLVSFVAIVPVCVFLFSLLDRIRPAAIDLTVATATITIITPTPTRFVPPTATPYVAPTDAPPPTAVPPAAAAASGITVGGRVLVSGTGGGGLNFRDQPTTSGALLRKLAEGSVYEVVGGPREADGYVWWQLKDPADGVTGWGAQAFLKPAQ